MNSPLKPIDWEPLNFIPRGDAVELPAERGWQAWDEAVAGWDSYEARKAAIGPVSADEYEERCKQIAKGLGL